MRILKANPVKVSLTILVAGLLIVSLIFPYYAFHWGIKPCQGLPSDAANCGDGDFGGVLFLVSGGPLVLYGTVTLILALLLKLLRPNFNKRRFLTYIYVFLAALIALVAAICFA
jgi:hypothetical protein